LVDNEDNNANSNVSVEEMTTICPLLLLQLSRATTCADYVLNLQPSTKSLTEAPATGKVIHQISNSYPL